METARLPDDVPLLLSPCDWMNDLVAFPPDSPSHLALDDDSIDPLTLALSLQNEQSDLHSAATHEPASQPEGSLIEHCESDGSTDRPVAPTPNDAHHSAKKRQHPRLPGSAVKVLNAWCDAHADHPYPTEAEKGHLRAQTGLSAAQISTWMANARRRKNKLRHPKLASDIPGWNSMTPFDRWRNSPPEAEAATVSAIARAVASSAPEPRVARRHSYAQSQVTEFPFALSDFASLASSSSAPSSDGSSSSAASAFSTGSFNRFHSGMCRRRRRIRKQGSALASSQPKAAGKRPYQCTFCTDTFKTRYDWMRHEKTLHLSLEKWVCMPFGPLFYDEKRQKAQCAFCGLDDPHDDHVESHRHRDCTSKPLAARTFYRKDHLVQHLRLVHGTSKLLPSMQQWKSDINRVNARCGFCSQRFTAWSDRNLHLAEHFRSGAQMKDWKGCRGLDPAFAAMVENAMPPYLIGAESKGMDPFSATARSGDGAEHASHEQQHGSDDVRPTPFAILTTQLGGFVHRAQQQGAVVTDEMIQREARQIVYGDNDPWNQTPADNAEWLRMFKMGHGLLSESELIDGICSDQLMHIEEVGGGLLDMTWPDEDLIPFLSTDLNPLAFLQSDSSALDSVGAGPRSDVCAGPQSRIQWALQTPECLAEYTARFRAASRNANRDNADSMHPHVTV